jgi:GTP-binding protein Era
VSDPAQEAPASVPRAGIVAIIGRANVGKSSLLNAILEEKVSIVTPVAQTTRNVIRGILTEPRGQLVFHDTPGVHKAASDLGRVMNRVARTAVEGADVALLVLDSSQPPREEDLGWMKRLRRERLQVVIVLHKSDLGGAARAALQAAWADAMPPPEAGAAAETAAPHPIWLEASARTGAGVAELVSQLFALVPEGPLLFPADVLTDFPRKLAMADVIREKLFADLRDELPHAVAVWVEEVVEDDAGLRVLARIYVQKHSQKGIIIGEKGRQLRKVRRASEVELAVLYQKPVSVEVWVKVEPKWDRNFWLLKKFGYVP